MRENPRLKTKLERQVEEIYAIARRLEKKIFDLKWNIEKAKK